MNRTFFIQKQLLMLMFMAEICTFMSKSISLLWTVQQLGNHRRMTLLSSSVSSVVLGSEGGEGTGGCQRIWWRDSCPWGQWQCIASPHSPPTAQHVAERGATGNIRARRLSPYGHPVCPAERPVHTFFRDREWDHVWALQRSTWLLDSGAEETKP